MAIPTFTSITPDSGSTQGRYHATIIGTNFRLPPEPPAIVYIGEDEPQTVRVRIDDKDVIGIQVKSSTELIINIPDYRGSAKVHPIPSSDIEITNLDDDGEPIPGETVLAADAFTYYRPQLDTEADLTRIVRKVIRMFRRQIMPNVVLTTHTDYDDSTADNANITALAELPGIILEGPSLRRNTFYTDHSKTYHESGIDKEYSEKRPARTVDLIFDFTGIAEHDIVLLNMLATVEQFFEKNPYIFLDRDPSNSDAGQVKYELELVTEPTIETTAALNNVGNFVGTFEIRGFDIELDAERIVREVDDLLIQIEQFGD